MNKLNNGYEDTLVYCCYCKTEVYSDDDYVKKNNDIYHKECWEQKYGIREELNFDE